MGDSMVCVKIATDIAPLGQCLPSVLWSKFLTLFPSKKRQISDVTDETLIVKDSGADPGGGGGGGAQEVCPLPFF